MMASIHDWARRLLNGQPADTTPVRRALVFHRGRYILVDPDAPLKGVHLVMVPPELLERYHRNEQEAFAIQVYLRTLPRSLRPRKRQAKALVAKT